MSGWEAYVPQIQACSADAGGGIFSLEDGTPWCQYGSLCDDREAVQNIVECCKNQDPCRKPVKIKGEKQMVLRVAEDELVAKNGTKSAVVAKIMNKCVIIGVGGEGVDARAINPGICKLGDYLKSSGY